jgi:hypothetical protein
MSHFLTDFSEPTHTNIRVTEVEADAASETRATAAAPAAAVNRWSQPGGHRCVHFHNSRTPACELLLTNRNCPRHPVQCLPVLLHLQNPLSSRRSATMTALLCGAGAYTLEGQSLKKMMHWHAPLWDYHSLSFAFRT